MHIERRVTRLNALASRAAGTVQDVFLFGLRTYVSWQFLKSGWLKLQDWDTTLFLFDEEYHVPIVSPVIAAVLGTAGEVVFPLLLVIGLFTRYAALGLSVVNAMAVVAYAHVLLAEGFEAALAQHWLWGLMLVTLVVFGPGRLSLDRWAARRAGHIPQAGGTGTDTVG